MRAELEISHYEFLFGKDFGIFCMVFIDYWSSATEASITALTDTGLEKKIRSPVDPVRSEPTSTPRLVFRNKFERENSNGP